MKQARRRLTSTGVDQDDQGAVKLHLNWRKPLFHCLLPIWLVLVLIGFPLPIAPPRPSKAAQVQSVPADESASPRAQRGNGLLS